MIPVSTSTNDTESQIQQISGVFNTSQIELSFRLTCLPNFTGSLCDKVCTDECSCSSTELCSSAITTATTSTNTEESTTSTNTEEAREISEQSIFIPIVIVLAGTLAVVIFIVVCLCLCVRRRSKRAARFSEVVKYVSGPGSAQVVVTGNEMDTSYTLADASTSGHVTIVSV